LVEKLSEFLNKGTVEWLQKEKHVDSIPIGFLRGLNWNARCIIADEAQNMTHKELVTLVTRVGEFSKVFILGDPDQSDIGLKSGFIKLTDQFRDDESKENGIHVFEFDENDIVRSALVKFIVTRLKQISVR
jgi:phosphate starvation-inducible protein PhoH